MNKKEKRKIQISPYLFIAPFFLVYIGFNLFPILYSFYISFTDWDGIHTPQFIGVKNYIRLFTVDPYFWKSVLNTFLFVAVCVPALVFGGMLMAVMLNAKWVKGKRTLQCLSFLPYLTTPVAIGLIFALIFDWQTGILNRVLQAAEWMDTAYDWLGSPGTPREIVNLKVVWKYLGYNTMFFLSGMAGISSDIYEAAEIEGAGTVQIFFKITVPLLKNIMVFVMLTSIIGGLQLLEEPMQLFSGWATSSTQLGGPGSSCLTVMWYLYDTAFGTTMRQGLGAAISYSLFVIIAVFAFFSYRLSYRGEDAYE